MIVKSDLGTGINSGLNKFELKTKVKVFNQLCKMHFVDAAEITLNK
jgi:hypothetical protein